jgi:hypothetical protein
MDIMEVMNIVAQQKHENAIANNIEQVIINFFDVLFII